MITFGEEIDLFHMKVCHTCRTFYRVLQYNCTQIFHIWCAFIHIVIAAVYSLSKLAMELF